MTKLFLLFSHKLTQKQKREATESLGVDEIIPLPDDLQKIWSQVSPEGELDRSGIGAITEWLEETGDAGDYVLVQGEFGVTFFLVDWCFNNDFIPLYATSRREYTEKTNSDGSIERNHVFRHVQFRKYIRP